MKSHQRASNDSTAISKSREWRQRDLRWDDRRLRLRSGRLLATIEPDAEWPGMWRVRLLNGRPTDMVNLTRARDAAITLALGALNQPHSKAA
jgi:hypothetical protein